ncbi:MAG TPA: hypothetical protein VHO70_06190 [Chitinispirillaceae bacterium]|nr:hypothetical protein [Chitinispirillaceae bacterium]
MKKTTVTYSIIKFFIVLFCCSVITLPNNLDSTIVKKRVQLISKNDSLDLIKQTFKRRGLSLSELEEKQSVIRDSLKMLNLQIQNTKISPGNSTLPDLVKQLYKKPETMFDWIIIIVGLIAVISGVFLLTGIISMFSSKKRAAKSRKTVKKVSEPPSKKAAVPPQPAASSKQAIDELRALASNTPDSVKQLRRQLKSADSKSSGPDIVENDNKPSLQEEMSPPLFMDSTQQHDIQTQQKIIEAAKNGMKPYDISRKYHMSTDQVLLILKVAGVKQKK